MLLESIFGETGGAVAQFVFALIAVVVLIVLVAWVIKRLGGARYGASQSGKAELEIVDAIVIDQKRRLVLVRHGRLEHLLLIGGGSDEVVERSMVDGIPLAARLAAKSRAQPNQSAREMVSPGSKISAAQMHDSAGQPASEDLAAPSGRGQPNHDQLDPEPETSLDRDSGGAAAAASTGLAAAMATSGIAAAVARRDPHVSPDPPESAPVAEAEPIAPPPSRVDEELERSIERAFEEAPLRPSSEGVASADSSLETPRESTLAQEIEAALGEMANRPDESEPNPAENSLPVSQDAADASLAEVVAPEPTEKSSNVGSAPDTDDGESPEETSVSLEDTDLKDAPAAPLLSSARPDPVRVTIPSRGPAASAVTVNQDDLDPPESISETEASEPSETGAALLQTDDVEPSADAQSLAGDDEKKSPSDPVTTEMEKDEPEAPVAEQPGALPDLSELIDPESQKPEPSSNLGEDLDEEMRRLLGEIAGGPKTN